MIWIPRTIGILIGAGGLIMSIYGYASAVYICFKIGTVWGIIGLMPVVGLALAIFLAGAWFPFVIVLLGVLISWIGVFIASIGAD